MPAVTPATWLIRCRSIAIPCWQLKKFSAMNIPLPGASQMRRVLLLLVLCCVGFAQDQSALKNQDPDAALISTSDIVLFWHAYDAWVNEHKVSPDKLAEVLQHEYLDRGSPGVKDFTPRRIVSAENLSHRILADRAYYEDVRHNTE